MVLMFHFMKNVIARVLSFLVCLAYPDTCGFGSAPNGDESDFVNAILSTEEIIGSVGCGWTVDADDEPLRHPSGIPETILDISEIF
jgi:hypothetical protein